MCCHALIRLLYEEKEQLEYLCIFDAEQKRLCHTWITKRILFRIIFAAFIFPAIPGWFLLHEYSTFFSYATNWGHLVTMASLIVSAYVPYSQTYRRKPRLMAWNHALLSCSVLLMCIIMPVYWSMVHQSILQRNVGNHIKVAYTYYTHTVPAAACLYNFTVTDFLFSRSYAKFTVFLVGVFMTINFTVTQLTGIITYQFLKWQDPIESVCVVTLFTLLALGLVYLLAFVSEISKSRRLPIIEKEGK